MQIHIWQQFAANHSADFTLVGEFETPDVACPTVATIF
jgi:hypothetical protein